MQKIRLNDFPVHPFKTQLMEAGISQLDLSISLQISQAQLSKLLNGYIPMPEKMELKIKQILDSLKPKVKLRQPIIIKRV